jgi:hypothetical protein
MMDGSVDGEKSDEGFNDVEVIRDWYRDVTFCRGRKATVLPPKYGIVIIPVYCCQLLCKASRTYVLPVRFL